MNQLETIAGHLEKLQGEAYLQLREGPLKDSLLQVAAADEEGSPFSGEGELEVVVECRADDGEPLVAVRVKDEDEGRRLEVPASALGSEALEEISACLVRLAAKEDGTSAAICDEEDGEGGEGSETFGMVAAANRLRVSPAWLKSVIPCTFYTYEEIDGRKKIKEYFWSRELIRILHLLRSKKASPQEVEFIAEHCCEGDIAWSREIIGRLKSYSRGEAHQNSQQKAHPPQKGQPQKAQQKPQQQKAQQQKSQQPKGNSPLQKPQQQGKPAQNPARPQPRPRPEGERGRKPTRSQ